MHSEIREEWFRHFHERVNSSPELRKQSGPKVTKRREWTNCMTEIISETCRACGLFPASHAVKGGPLPKPNNEYLQVDVMAFGDEGKWTAPIVAVEIENRKPNSKGELAIEFALWKSLQISCPLRVVIFKRHSEQNACKTIKNLENMVIQPLLEDLHYKYQGETYVGILLQDSISESSAETKNKPIDFFWSRLNPDTGKFEKTEW